MIIGIAFVNSFWLVDELTLVLSKISFFLILFVICETFETGFETTRR